jgi:choice-of-anchor A domain-containing protein
MTVNSPDRHRTPSPRTRRGAPARIATSLGLALALGALAAPADAATTQVDPFDLAGGFSVYARGDAHLTNHETEGAIAVGGELTVRADGGTYAVLHQAAGTADYTIPTVDGDPTRLLVGTYAPGSGLTQITNHGVPAGSGSELEGYLKVVGDDPTFDTYQRADWTRYRTATEGAPAIDATNQAWPDGVSTLATERDTVAAYVESGPGVDTVRQCLADLTTGDRSHRLTVTEDVGDRVVLSAVEPGVPNVIDYADIAGANQVQFADGTLPSADAPLIVSVPADVTELSGKVFGSAGKAAPYVMWDLSQHDGAVTLDGSGTRVDGSVYAPEADLVVDAAPIDGQIVAANLDLRGGEAHAYFFAGTLPCGTTAAPTGSISVTKLVDGEAADDVPGGTAYTIAYQVDGAETGTLELVAGEEQTLEELPAGAEVTLTEQDLPQVDDVAWAPVEWRIDGDQVDGASATVEAGTDVEVVLVNTATEEPADPSAEPTEEPTVEPTEDTSPSPSGPGTSEPGEPASDPAATAGDDGTDDSADDVVRTQSHADVTDGELPVTGPRVAAVILLALALIGSGVLVVLFRRQRP